MFFAVTGFWVAILSLCFFVCDSADFVKYLAQRSVLRTNRVYIRVIKTFVGHESKGPVNVLGMHRIKLQFNSNE